MRKPILAAKPAQPRNLCMTAGITFKAEAAPGAKPASPRFSMVAYTGGAMRLAGWDRPVVVDLAGLEIPAQKLPIRRGHDSRQVVGHTERVGVDGGTLAAEGVLSFKTPAAQEIVDASKNGFPWQASLGAEPLTVEDVPEGGTVEANGQTFEGPVTVARSAVLCEISIVDLGADRETSTRVAAQAKPQEDQTMTPEQKKALAAARAHLAAGRIEEAAKAFQALASVAHADVEALKADLDAAQEKAKPIGEDPVEDDPVLRLRAQVAAEHARIEAVTKSAGANAELRTKAIAQGWTVEKTELEALRAERPAGPAIHGRAEEPVTDDVMEAAICMAGKLNGVEKKFKAEVLEAASKRFRGHVGPQEVLLTAARANGYLGRGYASDPKAVLQAAFSTMGVSQIFANVLNKFLEQGWMNVERTWAQISATKSVKDFKQSSSYRLSGDLKYEEVGPQGELKHGTLGEQVYHNQLKTYGKMFSITRQDLINDDLGALTEIPAMIGRGAALKMNEVFWTVWVGAQAANFFSAGNKNLDASTASLFGIDGLTLAERMFFDQVDPDGNPLGLAPAYILVPNALFTPANQVMRSTELRDTTANTKFAVTNPHTGKFEVLRSSYLSNAGIAGASTKHWYLLGRPSDIAAIEVAFLNGQQTPMVEAASANFETLGIQARGFHDFGVALQEPRAAIKLRGES